MSAIQSPIRSAASTACWTGWPVSNVARETDTGTRTDLTLEKGVRIKNVSFAYDDNKQLRAEKDRLYYSGQEGHRDRRSVGQR